MLLFAFLITFAFIGISRAAPEETANVYYLEYGGLKIDVRAPSQSYPGENITITVKAEAITDIYVNYIQLRSRCNLWCFKCCR